VDQSTIERIEGLTQAPAGWLGALLPGLADADMALRGLETWLVASGSPALYAEELWAHPAGAHRLLQLLGTSGPVAQSFQQNPELGIALLDEAIYNDQLEADDLLAEGQLLLQASRSYTHGLDRIRFLKQKWSAVIVSHDLDESWPQPKVWTALSTLADVVLELATEWVWKSVAPGQTGPCPVGIVAFGKHGGREVNYSSDLDLVYVLHENIEESLEPVAVRFCETLGRALEDPMGRGKLYRVDLRLRPYGAAGPLLAKFRAYRAYYELYAEAWEVQALLRSRVVWGSDGLRKDWEQLRRTTCFGRPLSEVSLDAMLAMRERIEQTCSANDIKRGAGGIRDVEFIGQILQLATGLDPAEPTTLRVLTELGRTGRLSKSDCEILARGYEWLRKLEHRIQFEDSRQTHEVPTNGPALIKLARLMNEGSADQFVTELKRRRAQVSSVYNRLLPTTSLSYRDQVLAQEPRVQDWFDTLPERDEFYRQLAMNADSMDRVLPLVRYSPRLVESLKQSLPITEEILSGEVLEDLPQQLSFASSEELPVVYRESFLGNLVQFAIAGGSPPVLALSRLAEQAIMLAAQEAEFVGSVIALGSLGREDMGPGSDADVLLLVADKQQTSEQSAQVMLRLLQNWRQRGMPLEVDSRLRPDGSKGLLVRTLHGFDSYAARDMENWERFALGNARLIFGEPHALQHVLAAARIETDRQQAWTELVGMKARIEKERVQAHHVQRDVKLGYGGLSDIEWTVRMIELLGPCARRAQEGADLKSRIRKLNQEGFLNVFEAEILNDGLTFLLEVRMRLVLAGFEGDLIPENPDKLQMLAEPMGLVNANEFLDRKQRVCDDVRNLFQETIERLRG
jgi:glutamate-ammonia-ligase adenylyltransferase